VLVAAVFAIGMMMMPASLQAAPCDWEWGGIAEAIPSPCGTPVAVSLTPEPSPAASGAGCASPCPVTPADTEDTRALWVAVSLLVIGSGFAFGKQLVGGGL
jgi:hypothetical protein